MPPIRERELIKPPVGHLLVLFIAVPVVELALLIEIGQRVGTVGTIGLIMGTGIVGAALARQQGISTLARLRADLDAGRWPAEPIVDGVLILVAAAVLITPGVLTDLAGFLCLVPACRQLLKRYLHQRFEGTDRNSIGEPHDQRLSRCTDMEKRPAATQSLPARGRSLFAELAYSGSFGDERLSRRAPAGRRHLNRGSRARRAERPSGRRQRVRQPVQVPRRGGSQRVSCGLPRRPRPAS